MGTQNWITSNAQKAYLAGSTRKNLPHHLLLTGSASSSLLEFAHIFPVTLTLLDLGIDTAGHIKTGRGWDGDAAT